MRRIVLLAAAMTAALLLISGVALAAELIGTPGNDRLAGTEKRDLISARGGDDTVIGRMGDDELYGMPGGDNNDTINAVGGGHDLINCGLGTDDQVIADTDDGVNGDCERVTRR
jgi:Ca2+-binding RTX toxin-like protein